MPLSKITNPFLDPAGSARSNVYSPSANTIGIVTAGTERVRVDSSGNMGIGASSISNRLEVVQSASADASAAIRAATNGYAASLKLIANDATGSRYNTLNSFYGSTEQWSIRSGAADSTMTFCTGSSATERMRIDSSGRVTKPAQPAFRVTRDGGGNVTTDEIIPFNYAILNTGSHFNLSTYTFTAPVAGNYFFSFGGMNNQTNSVGASLFRLFINGAQSSYLHITNSHPSNASNSLVYYMNASDTAYVRGSNYHHGPGSSGNDYPYFSGYLLG
jgi:hypothetical protein